SRGLGAAFVALRAASGCASGGGTPTSAGAGTAAASAPVSTAQPPAMDAIRESDLRRDIFALAGDAMRGREAGTLDEMRASVWLAERAREAGLEPAGDDGTYFQFWPIRRTRLSEGSRISIGGRTLQLWRDAVVTAPVTASVDVPIVFVDGNPEDPSTVDLKGKAAAVMMRAPTNPPAPNVSLRPYRYALAAVRQQSQALIDRGAAAVIIVSDSVGDDDMAWGFGGAALSRGRYGLDTARAASPASTAPGVPVLWVRRQMLDAVRAPNQRLSANFYTESFSYPSVNVVGRVRGTDASRRDEYVLFSGHQDHDGVRYPIDGDSIWNGADDNATVSVALLAIGRAWAARPGARSALFVWHGAEERGL